MSIRQNIGSSAASPKAALNAVPKLETYMFVCHEPTHSDMVDEKVRAKHRAWL